MSHYILWGINPSVLLASHNLGFLYVHWAFPFLWFCWSWNTLLLIALMSCLDVATVAMVTIKIDKGAQSLCALHIHGLCSQAALQQLEVELIHLVDWLSRECFTQIFIFVLLKLWDQTTAQTGVVFTWLKWMRWHTIMPFCYKANSTPDEQ